MQTDSKHTAQGLHYPVYFGKDIWCNLKNLLETEFSSSTIFILTDENVGHLCLPSFLDKVPALADSPLFSIPAGEKSKDISVAAKSWDWLANYHAERSDLLINLGGGMVSDLGGFVASAYKRGMPYINIPTSLTGQVDAAIGGKTGVNFSGYKNLLGVFSDPYAVFVNFIFLKTLPKRELYSGFSEIIKSSLIAGEDFWEEIKKGGLDAENGLNRQIIRAASLKISIVDKDSLDLHERKSLNFGHTIGHAFESISMETGQRPLLHGEAVAAGIICESYISHKLIGLSEDTLNDILHLLKRYFPPLKIDFYEDDFYRYLIQDKKSQNGVIRMSLLNAPGTVLVDQPASMEMITESIEYYKEMTSP